MSSGPGRLCCGHGGPRGSLRPRPPERRLLLAPALVQGIRGATTEALPMCESTAPVARVGWRADILLHMEALVSRVSRSGPLKAPKSLPGSSWLV